MGLTVQGALATKDTRLRVARCLPFKNKVCTGSARCVPHLIKVPTSESAVCPCRVSLFASNTCTCGQCNVLNVMLCGQHRVIKKHPPSRTIPGP